VRAAIDRGAGVFETMLMLDGRLVNRHGHLRRLADSIEAVYGSHLPAGLDRDLDGLLPRRSARVRVSVWPNGESLASKVEVELHQPRRPAPPLTLIPVRISGGLGCHKWRDRSWLEDQRRQRGCGADGELLLLDSEGEVLETERAAVLIVEGARLVAAPDDARRLPSLTRLGAITVSEEVGLVGTVQPIGFERLLAADQVLVASSVRLIVAAAACGNRQWPPTDVAQRLTNVLIRDH
jgi:para-aminobenzoate synthetase/4-amino-4-deoxychorismate lyase